MVKKKSRLTTLKNRTSKIRVCKVLTWKQKSLHVTTFITITATTMIASYPQWQCPCCPESRRHGSLWVSCRRPVARFALAADDSLVFVETQSHSTKIPHPNRTPTIQKYKPTEKNMTWQDALFSRCLPESPSQIGSNLHGDCHRAK